MQRSLATAMSRAQDDAPCDGAGDVAAEVAAMRAMVVASSRRDHRCCVGLGSSGTTQRLRIRGHDNAERGGATASASARDGAAILDMAARAHGDC